VVDDGRPLRPLPDDDDLDPAFSPGFPRDLAKPVDTPVFKPTDTAPVFTLAPLTVVLCGCVDPFPGRRDGACSPAGSRTLPLFVDWDLVSLVAPVAAGT